MSETALKTGNSVTKYKVHWHVLFTHFPVAFFMGSMGFMLLHVFTHTSCFELAGYVVLIAGAVSMVPTTLTGWYTWKGRYQGLKGKLFLTKIRISFAMLTISFALVIYRAISQFVFLDIAHNVWHALYFTGVILLTVGSVAEGYYGGRLNHR
jgi:uncharacterized membrane protein